MKLVVVGGHSRKVGKTSVVAGVIGGLASLGWTAVKISPHRHVTNPPAGEVGSANLAASTFSLTEASGAAGHGDTSRYLAAGARHAWWSSFEEGHLEEACGRLLTVLQGAEHVIIESNSVLEFVKPSVYLMVLDSSQADFKPSAARTIHRADAFVLIGQAWRANAWPKASAKLLERKPLFPIRALGEASPDLCGFVWERLQESDVDNPLSGRANLLPVKEQPWRP